MQFRILRLTRRVSLTILVLQLWPSFKCPLLLQVLDQSSPALLTQRLLPLHPRICMGLAPSAHIRIRSRLPLPRLRLFSLPPSVGRIHALREEQAVPFRSALAPQRLGPTS